MSIKLHQDALFEIKNRMYCTYEVFMVSGCVFVGCGTIMDALALKEIGRNSELAKIYLSAPDLQVRIIATSPSLHECKIYMLQRLKQYDLLPHCNRYGALSQSTGSQTMIEASDGRTWSTQEECAADLHLTQAHVSRMVKSGKPNSRGLILRRVQLHL
jgi:hypothetical protein